MKKLACLTLLATLTPVTILFPLTEAIAQPETTKTFSLGHFTPVEDGFSFTNIDLTTQIKENYLVNQEAEDAFNVQAMVYMFGSEVCLADSVEADNTENCVLTETAKRWLSQNLENMKNGVCEGMALSSLYLWLGRNNLDNWDRPDTVIIPMDALLADGKNGSSRTKDIAISNSNLHTYASLLFAMQTLETVYQEADRNRTTKTPSQLLQTIQASFAAKETYDATVDPIYTIGIYRVDTDQSLTQGHTLVPYKAVDSGDGITKLFVYDNNYVYGSDAGAKQVDPRETFIEFKGDQWRYQPPNIETPYYGDASSQNLDISLLETRDPEEGYHDCPFCRSATGEIAIDLFGAANMTIKDLTTGRGVDDSTAIPFKGGLDLDVAPTYRLSANGSYQVTLRGSVDGKTAQELSDTQLDEWFGEPTDGMENPEDAGADDDSGLFEGESFFEDKSFLFSSNFVVTGANLTMGAEDLALQSGDRFDLFVNSRPHQNADNEQAKAKQLELSLRAAKEGDAPLMFTTIEEADASYDIVLGGVPLRSGNSVLMRVDSSKQLIYIADNNGQADTYTIDLQRTSFSDVSDQMAEEEFYTDVEVPADQVLVFDYGSWQLQGTDLVFYVVDLAALENPMVEYLSFETSKLTDVTDGSQKIVNRAIRGCKTRGC
jgi:hypothetical protein